jgi:hypothetical protein
MAGLGVAAEQAHADEQLDPWAAIDALEAGGQTADEVKQLLEATPAPSTETVAAVYRIDRGGNETVLEPGRKVPLFEADAVRRRARTVGPLVTPREVRHTPGDNRVVTQHPGSDWSRSSQNRRNHGPHAG